jgi:hypothetical protein
VWRHKKNLWRQIGDTVPRWAILLPVPVTNCTLCRLYDYVSPRTNPALHPSSTPNFKLASIVILLKFSSELPREYGFAVFRLAYDCIIIASLTRLQLQFRNGLAKLRTMTTMTSALTTNALSEPPKHSPGPLKRSPRRVRPKMSAFLRFRGSKTSDDKGKSEHSDTSTTRSLYLEDSSTTPGTLTCFGESKANGCLKVVTQKESLSHLYESEKSHKSVRWSTIDFYSHEMLLGDNPSVSSGPPLTISWKAHEHHPISIEEYEKFKPVRRRKSEMLSPRQMREDLLMGAGYNRSDLKEAATEAAAIRQMRHRSLKDGQFKAMIMKWKPL